MFAQFASTFTHHMGSFKAAKRPKRPTNRAARPTVEALEDRFLLARTLLWTAAQGGSWSDANTWTCSASGTPTDVGGHFAPTNIDSLVFDPSQSVMGTSGANTASKDDINAGAGDTAANLTIASGYTSTITVNGGSNLRLSGNFSMAAGTLKNTTGAGGDNRNFTFASAGTFTWRGGTISLPTYIGSGTTRPTVNLQGDADKTLGADMKNYGTLTWTGGGNFMFTSGASFENQDGATFDIQTDKQIGVVGTASPQITNNGAFKKSAGGGTTTIVPDFDSIGGTLTFGSGTLAFTGVVRQLFSDATTVLNGGSFQTARTFQLIAGSLTGVGTINGAVDSSSRGNVIPGLNGAPGTLNIVGGYTQGDNATLTINIDATGNAALLNVQGAATLAGTLTVNRNANYLPTSGDLTFLKYTAVNGDFATDNLFDTRWTAQDGQLYQFWRDRRGDSYHLYVNLVT